MENEKRAARSQQEDAILNRVLIWFGGAIVLEFIMLLLNRFYINYTTETSSIMLAYYLGQVIYAAVFVCLALCALSVVWYVTARRRGSKAHLPLVLTVVFAALFVCTAVSHWFQRTGVQLLYVTIPVAAVMVLVFYLYQKEFFAVAALGAMGILGLWILRKAGGGHTALVYGYMAAAAAILVCAALLARALQARGGVLSWKEKKTRIFPKNANYAMLYLTCAVVAVILIAACVLGTAAAYYLIFALVAWLFIMAVYYTVKLM